MLGTKTIILTPKIDNNSKSVKKNRLPLDRILGVNNIKGVNTICRLGNKYGYQGD